MDENRTGGYTAGAICILICVILGISEKIYWGARSLLRTRDDLKIFVLNVNFYYIKTGDIDSYYHAFF